MPTLDDPVLVYKELSDQYDRRGEPPMRDRFLVLAADAALAVVSRRLIGSVCVCSS